MQIGIIHSRLLKFPYSKSTILFRPRETGRSGITMHRNVETIFLTLGFVLLVICGCCAFAGSISDAAADEEKIVHEYGLPWKSLAEKGFVLKVVPGSPGEKDMAELKEFLRKRYEYLLGRFEKKKLDHVLNIYIHPAEKITKESILVSKGGGCALINEKDEIEVHLYYAKEHSLTKSAYAPVLFRDVASNEMVKGFLFSFLLSHNGREYWTDISGWFMEGAGVCFQGDKFDNHPIHTWAALFMEEDLLLPLGDLLFTSRALRSGVRKKTLEAFEKVYKRDLSKLEAEWKDFLAESELLYEKIPEDMALIINGVKKALEKE